MAKRVWAFDVEGKHHTVELEHGYWSGKREIIVDGAPIERSRSLIDHGSQHQFSISDIGCVLRIISRRFRFDYELWVGGKKVEPQCSK